MIDTQEIAILDFGSQYTHLIARRVRELGVRSHIYHNDIPAADLKNAVGIILSGGPRSLVRDPRLEIDEAIFDMDIPILGLCYGHQLMADHFGGTVASGSAREYGIAELKETSKQETNNIQSLIFNNITFPTQIWMSHGDHVEHLPNGFSEIATSGNESVAAMAHDKKRMYGFQFHPEVNHSKEGMAMLSNFIFDICKAQKNWTNETMLEEIKNEIKIKAGTKNIFLLISGGVDSTVCFALLEKTLGKERVYGLHVDHGFMREGESAKVVEALKAIGLDDLHVYKAETEYLAALEGISDPEEKRTIIGNLFLDITDKVMKEQGCDETGWLLGQGTIYPDTIESGGTKNADKIKTHHNRVDRVQEMIDKGLVIEPIAELYKDEVREIGRMLGLPDALVDRHPFPGPGLAIRCLCSEGDESTTTTVIARSRSEAETTKQSTKPNNHQLLKLPVKSVGVQGDERTYAHPALILPSPSKGGLGRGPELHELISLAPRITNEHKEINRVLSLVHGDREQLATSTVRRAHLTKERLESLRAIDAIVNKHISTERCNHIWQFPVVLVPFGYDTGESIVLRPVESKEAMTVSFAALPQDILEAIVRDIAALKTIDYIFFDATNKPPGTIEWE